MQCISGGTNVGERHAWSWLLAENSSDKYVHHDPVATLMELPQGGCL